jgi:hypothetical protein
MCPHEQRDRPPPPGGESRGAKKAKSIYVDKSEFTQIQKRLKESILNVYFNTLTTVQNNRQGNFKGACVEEFADCSDPKLEPGT